MHEYPTEPIYEKRANSFGRNTEQVVLVVMKGQGYEKTDDNMSSLQQPDKQVRNTGTQAMESNCTNEIS